MRKPRDLAQCLRVGMAVFSLQLIEQGQLRDQGRAHVVGDEINGLTVLALALAQVGDVRKVGDQAGLAPQALAEGRQVEQQGALPKWEFRRQGRASGEYRENGLTPVPGSGWRGRFGHGTGQQPGQRHAQKAFPGGIKPAGNAPVDELDHAQGVGHDHAIRHALEARADETAHPGKVERGGMHTLDTAGQPLPAGFNGGIPGSGVQGQSVQIGAPRIVRAAGGPDQTQFMPGPVAVEADTAGGGLVLPLAWLLELLGGHRRLPTHRLALSNQPAIPGAQQFLQVFQKACRRCIRQLTGGYMALMAECVQLAVEEMGEQGQALCRPEGESQRRHQRRRRGRHPELEPAHGQGAEQQGQGGQGEAQQQCAGRAHARERQCDQQDDAETRTRHGPQRARMDQPVPDHGGIGVGVELHPGERVAAAGDGRGQDITKAGGGVAHEQCTAGKPGVRHPAFEHIDVGKAWNGTGPGEGNVNAVAAHVHIGCRLLPGFRCLAPDTGLHGHGVCKAGPGGFAQPLAPEQGSGNAIVVQLRVHVAQCRCCPGQPGGWQEFPQGAFTVPRENMQGQDHVSVALHGTGQQPIVVPFLRGLGKEDVQRDGPRARLIETLDQAGMTVARPGPAAQGFEALLVNGDNGQILRWRDRHQADEGVVQPEVQPLGGGSAEQQDQHGEQGQSEVPACQAAGGQQLGGFHNMENPFRFVVHSTAISRTSPQSLRMGSGARPFTRT